MGGPTMMKFLWRTDAHIADLPPQSRVDDWASVVLDKLKQVGDLARERKAALVLDGGDLFHIKSPSRTSHELIQRITEVHRAYPCPVVGNVGNHDVKYQELRYLPESPLGVLFKSGVILPCFDEHEIYVGFPHGEMLQPRVYPYHREYGFRLGDPFQECPGEIVRIVGVPYHGTTYDREMLKALQKGKETYLFAMCHCLASDKGGSMFESEDIFSYNELASMAPTVWFMGHWHKNQGVTRIGEKWIINTGSLTRGSLALDDIDRHPVCVEVRVESGSVEIQEHPLKISPFTEVFDVAGKTRKEAQRVTVDSLVETLKGVAQRQVETSLLDDVRQIKDVPEPVLERVVYYLEQAGVR